MTDHLTLSLVQTTLAWEDAGSNRSHLSGLLDNVGATDLIVLPEMFSTGFSMNAGTLAEPMDGETVAWMQSIAKHRGAAVCGSVIIAANSTCYNRFILARPDGDLVTYDKRHLFRMSTENDNYTGGSVRTTMHLNDFTLFPQVCYDLRFPVFSRNDLGFDVMIYVANWPAARRNHWRTLLAARAIENQCYVVGVNRIGIDGNQVAYAGDSLAINFAGETIVDLRDEDTIATISLDRTALERYRENFPAWKDADPFSLR